MSDGSAMIQKNADVALSEKMKQIELKRQEQEAQVHAADLGFGYINLENFPIDQDALSLIDESQARALGVLCIFQEMHIRKIVAVHPDEHNVQEFIKQFSNNGAIKVDIMLTSQHSWEEAMKLYARLPKKIVFSDDVTISEDVLSQFQAKIHTLKDLTNALAQVQMTDKVAMILAGGLKSDASDVHIEAEENRIVVRYRIDGILHEVAELPSDTWQQVISRIKLVSKMKINITTKSQDGRITIRLKDDAVDVRVSTIPTAFGESVVMRLLRSSHAAHKFEALGLRGSAYVLLEKEIARPNGMIVTTGPTGSGKTTTLYAIINKLNDSETKIITLEDPIEYKLKGINQSQVDVGKGYTFAAGLRSILRQDPDIVMVGELRDLETADTAINASLTGHLVVSTLHTNDAAGAIPRFLAMGVKPFLLGPSLNAVIGQRLVRKLCEKCKKQTSLVPDTQERVEKLLSELPDAEKAELKTENIFYKAVGCEACQGMGYKGRVGVYEIFQVGDDIEKAISEQHVSEAEMRDIARAQGMVTMAQDGILKALTGETSVDEVFRVTE
ncbi:MAG TPA: GspE/PulE family protein [Patescibacteria group bacterium]|nr:GspE/PulE family protein [Patescibacteria group bacterium]